MIDYRVRSVSLLNLVNDVRKEILIPDAYFQRNLVWREIHNKDFIKTILLGYPFPQIFISKGKVDVAKMSTVSCIVDGQQRTNAILKFIENKYDVDGKFYRDLTQDEQSDFLKYEVAVIELDLENDDPKVQEIFQRINRTSNSLTIIEKMASEFSTSDYMLVAKLLGDQIDLESEKNNEDFKEDPNIPIEFFIWARNFTIAAHFGPTAVRCTSTNYAASSMFNFEHFGRRSRSWKLQNCSLPVNRMNTRYSDQWVPLLSLHW